jgi:hypothetical protein
MMRRCTPFHHQPGRRGVYQEALKLAAAEPLALHNASLLVSDGYLKHRFCQVDSDRRRLHLDGLLYAEL